MANESTQEYVPLSLSEMFLTPSSRRIQSQTTAAAAQANAKTSDVVHQVENAVEGFLKSLGPPPPRRNLNDSYLRTQSPTDWRSASIRVSRSLPGSRFCIYCDRVAACTYLAFD